MLAGRAGSAGGGGSGGPWRGTQSSSVIYIIAVDVSSILETISKTKKASLKRGLGCFGESRSLLRRSLDGVRGAGGREETEGDVGVRGGGDADQYEYVAPKI